MGHSKVSQSPGHHGKNGDHAVGSCGIGNRIVNLGHGQISCKRACVIHNGVPSACNVNSVKNNNDQSNAHYNTLNQICGRNSHKSTHNSISDNHYSAYNHGCVVVKAEQTVKKSSDCLKAGCGIGNKENQDNDGRNAHQNIFLIPIPAGEELGYGDSVADNGIPAQPFCNNQPV